MPEDNRTLGRVVGELRDRLAARATGDPALAALLERLAAATMCASPWPHSDLPALDWPTFLAGLTHSLRNAVFAMAATADLLALGDPGGHSLPPSVPSLRQQVARMLRILADLDTFALAATAPASLAPLTSVLRDAKTATDPLATECQAAVREHYPDGTRMVHFQPRTLGRAVHSLLETAILRSRGRAPVELSESLLDDGYVEARIADLGDPLEPALLERALEPFAVRSGEITGLSFALAHRVALAHGGHLGVANRPQTGIVVSLRLPCHQGTTPA
jgi:signal transduction histidine kinase